MENNGFELNHALLEAAIELVEKFDNVADKLLPNQIVETIKFHSKGAAISGVASGWIPGAGGLALVGVTASFIWGMYIKINNYLGISFSENLVKSIGSGIATNLASYAVASIAVSTVLSLIPGLGSVGASAIVGTTSYALTLASGYVYIKLLASLSKIENVNEGTLKSKAKEIIENENITDILKKAKVSYKEMSSSN